MTADAKATGVDVAALIERFGPGRLCELASEKDSGFAPLVLVDMLGSSHRFALGDFALSADAYENLARSVELATRTDRRSDRRSTTGRTTQPGGRAVGIRRAPARGTLRRTQLGRPRRT
jgi:hypothetical protein